LGHSPGASQGHEEFIGSTTLGMQTTLNKRLLHYEMKGSEQGSSKIAKKNNEEEIGFGYTYNDIGVVGGFSWWEGRGPTQGKNQGGRVY